MLIDGFDGWIFRYVASLRPYPGIVRLVIEPRGDDPPGLINADFFRNIPLRDMLDVIAAVFQQLSTLEFVAPAERREAADVAATFGRQHRPGSGGRDPIFYAQLAARYVELAQVSPSPTADLIRELDLPDRTVRYYLARARTLGLLTSPERGHRAGGELTPKARRLLEENHET